MRSRGIFTIGFIALFLVDCANQSSRSGQNTRRKSTSKASLNEKDKESGKTGEDSSPESGGSTDKEEFTSSDELLHLAQNLMEKQKSEGDGICQGGACMIDTSTCAALNYKGYQYTLSADGSKCELDDLITCEAWEKKSLRKIPAWNTATNKWIPFEIEVCETDVLRCKNTTFNKNGSWYQWSQKEVTLSEYFDSTGKFHFEPVHSGPDEKLKSKDDVKKTIDVCERQNTYCQDSYGDESLALSRVDLGTLRTHNECSISPKYCRSLGLFLNAKGSEGIDSNISVSQLEWEPECSEVSSFKASKAICEAHGMSFNEASARCFSDNADSCQLASKVWIGDDRQAQFNQLIKDYLAFYKSAADSGKNAELNYQGFVLLDQAFEIDGKSEALKGWFPVQPGQRCQMANNDTCKIAGKIYDPYTFECKEKLNRNLMLVLRKIEIDNSTGCIDAWVEHEGPNASEMAQNVAGSILTLGLLPALGGWNDGTEVRKEAPFNYEIDSFSFHTSRGESGDVLGQAVKNIAIPHQKSYAFLMSKVFPVEIRDYDFSFDVRFDVFVKGKSLGSSGRVLFASEQDNFTYAAKPYPYIYKSLLPSLDGSNQPNEAASKALYDELKNELSLRHVTTSSANDSQPDWFKTGVSHVSFSGGTEEIEQAKGVPSDSTTRMSYTLFRNNFDDSIHKVSKIIQFNPPVDDGLGDDSETPRQTKVCYGRVVWSWQWFKGRTDS